MDSQLDLKQIPFVRVCVFYILGIYFSSVFPAKNSLLLLICPIVAFLLLFLFLIFIKKNSPIFKGILISIVIFNCGALSYNQCSQFIQLPPAECQYKGIVSNPSVRKEKSIQVDCRLNGIAGIQGTTLKEKVRLYLSPDSVTKKPEIGDSITFVARLSRIKNAGNPDEFDYAKYLSRDRIYYSGYVEAGKCSIGNSSGKYKLRRIANKVQNVSIKKLENYGFKGDELAVLSALTAGNCDLLSNDIISEYAATGALHVLSVSGLHVGILFMFLNLLFGNRNQFLYFRLIRLFVVFTVIWFYAFITGLSSPVLRASIMFSLFLIGKSFSRFTNNYNILAASAFLILVINPMEVFKVGFQFSYLAVFGILYFQPKMENLIIIKNSLIDRIWQLITVSIAAQLVTLPLSLYYFHQFPTYFLLTNLIVIPLTWAIMQLSILFFISLPFGVPSTFFAFLLNFLLKVLNYSIGYISNLPYAAIANIRFEPIHLVLWTTILVLITIYINYSRKTTLLYLAGGMLIVLVSIDMFNYFARSDEREILIYSMRKNTAVTFIDGHKHILLTEGLTETDWEDKSKYLKSFWISRQVHRNIVWIPLDQPDGKQMISGEGFTMNPSKFGTCLSFYEKQILYLSFGKNKDIKVSALPPDSIDMVLINRQSGYPRQEYEDLIKQSKALVCQNLSLRQEESWRQFANNKNLEFYDIDEQGAFVLKADKKNSAR